MMRQSKQERRIWLHEHVKNIIQTRDGRAAVKAHRNQGGYGTSSKTQQRYNVLRDLLAPAKPSEVKFEELVKTLRDHYEPKPIVIAERFHFHKLEQHEGEGVATYSAALKKCSEHCAFGTFLEEALRDRFVCGLRLSLIHI